MFRNYKNYDVCEDGRIWSKKYKKFLKPATTFKGYQQVGLVDNNGKLHSERLHKVVFCAVNGLWNLPEGYELDHIDENKMNNHISNLRLCTRKENCNFGTRNERIAKTLTNHPEKSKRVGAYDKNGELIMCFPSTQEAHRNGYSSGAVSACCRDCYMMEGNNVYKGYVWKYLDEQ